MEKIFRMLSIYNGSILSYIEKGEYPLAALELGNAIFMMRDALPQAPGRLRMYAIGLTARFETLQKYLFEGDELLIKSAMQLVEERLSLVGISADALAKNEAESDGNPQ